MNQEVEWVNFFVISGGGEGRECQIGWGLGEMGGKHTKKTR